MLQAAPKATNNVFRLALCLCLSRSTRRVRFEATMPKKEHAIWCYKQPQNISQTAPKRNLMLQAVVIATNNVFRLALTWARKNTRVGARRNQKITDHSATSSPTTEARQPQKAIWCYKQPQ